MNLDTGWVLMTGDNPDWADPGLNDADWHPIRVGVPWEESGFAGYDGYAWYRTRCVIPEHWSDQSQGREFGGVLMLSLGPIDDVDVTYFNGVQIGQTGRMPPDYATAYDQERMYRIPPDAIRWGQTNVVAVRVYDGEAPGGIYRGPVVIRQPVLADFLQLGIQPKSSDGVYDSSSSMVLSCSISNGLSGPVKAVLAATLQSDRIAGSQALEHIQTEVELEGHAHVTSVLEFHPSEPGFYRVACTLGDGATPLKSTSMIVGYAPEDMTTALTQASINRVLSYVDTMNLADRIQCPVLMSVGLQDDVCPPRTAFGTYNQVRSKKAYRVYPTAGHDVGDEHKSIKRQWMNDLLGARP